jgi:RNA polymerase sigma-70 factor (ECF subfamily)
MRDLEGFDYSQMAAILGLPLGTLKSRLFRARVALREQLQDHFDLHRRRGTEA